jgi:hypothetical protein
VDASQKQPSRLDDLMGARLESSTQEVLAGLVERVTYHNAENGFCVLRAKARGHRDIVTVVGHAAIVSAGEWITASGEWVNDRTHGQQFRARFLRTSPPTSADGIEKYLSSGMIRGIGPVYAKKLVRSFGENVFDVIEASPQRLRVHQRQDMLAGHDGTAQVNGSDTVECSFGDLVKRRVPAGNAYANIVVENVDAPQRRRAVSTIATSVASTATSPRMRRILRPPVALWRLSPRRRRDCCRRPVLWRLPERNAKPWRGHYPNLRLATDRRLRRWQSCP